MAVIDFSVRLVAACVGRPGLALVELSVVEQRYRAVLAVLAGSTVTEVAARMSVCWQTVSGWKPRYAAGGLAGLREHSRRPVSSAPGLCRVDVDDRAAAVAFSMPQWSPWMRTPTSHPATVPAAASPSR
ncbi:helix-turn-helix domain-containing protein [Streptomyces sp. KM273126]|uniref:helix-turn-helix domain-containing protein n=1 Tax=Streptomyces sp. KM273126 TaxID=2545247 RepID=UPI0028682B87|nr:helix-turn-helix domain-containing protein [Streptomyces sp. KM273126]